MTEQGKSILQLVDELEVLLHQELPEQATRCVGGTAEASHEADYDELRGVVMRMEQLQKEIGMAAYAMVRAGQAPPAVSSRQPLAPPDAEQWERVRERDPDGASYTLPGLTQGEKPAGGAEPPRPKCRACERFSETTCSNCNLPFCYKHVDHPCGDLA